MLLAITTLQAVEPVWYYSHFAGSTKGGGYRDGVGQAAKLAGAMGIAFDSAGYAYVCDTGNCVIRKISPAGVVTTWVGQPGVVGLVDGVGAEARLLGPRYCAFDRAGVLYVTDARTVRKITSDGHVTTVAGSSEEGSIDGSGAEARFQLLEGITVDADGTIYVADWFGCTVRKITTAGVVSTLAGSAGQQGYADATGAAARFSSPRGLTIAPDGNLVVADAGNNALRTVSKAGVVTTLVGNPARNFDQDGPLSSALIYIPIGITYDSTGTLYLTSRDYVKMITADGRLVSIAGGNSANPWSDGTGAAAGFLYPTAVARSPDGSLYVVDGRVRQVTLAGVTTTLAGSLPESGSANGTATAARFGNPRGMDVDSVGNLYVADTSNHTIRKITPEGVVTTFAGAEGQSGSADGPALTARFNGPQDVALDDDGTLYVSDGYNGTIRKISPAGIVTTLAGSVSAASNSFDVADGVGAAARFGYPMGLTTDGHGTVYVTEYFASTIRRVTSDGTVTTIAGSGNMGNADGTGAAAEFLMPTDLVVEPVSGTLYVADYAGGLVRKVTSAGVVTTLAGKIGVHDTIDGVGATAGFLLLESGIALDADGNILVNDYGVIRKVTPSGVVTTIGGARSGGFNASGAGASARFGLGYNGIAVNRSTGDFYISDSNNYAIRKASLVTPAISWTPPAAITYGTALSAAQLNATTNIDGDYSVYTYSPAAGTQLEAGTHTLNVTYSVPSAPEVPSLSTSVSLTVNPATPTVSWATPASISFGTALSATQLNATSPIDGTFTYSPALGSVLEMGTHELSVTFTPQDSKNYTTATARVNVTVTAAQLAGTYFGSFGSDHGRWALQVNADNTALFIGYLSSRSSAIVLNLTLNADGTFSASGSELQGAGLGGETAEGLSTATGSGRKGAAAGFTFSGRIIGNTLTGELGGLAEILSGTADRAAGGAAAGVYQAVALNAASGESHAIVASSGQAMVVVVSSSGADGATGTLAGGAANLTSAKGGSLSVALGGSGAFTAKLTPAGATAPVSFAGLAEGVVSTTRAVNIATRAYCDTEDKVTIGGFVVAGSAKKRVLVRAVGPSLTKHGLAANEVLADPTIEVHDALRGNATILENDNWGDGADAAQITSTAAAVGAEALLSEDTKSAGAVLELGSGVYTFVVKGKSGGKGIVLLEVYDADATRTGTNFTNIATRAYARTGNDVTIGGFVVNGNAPKRVLLRALGPTLISQGIKADQVLKDPTIELHDALNNNATIATNDDWGTNANAASIVTTAARIGATPIEQTDTKSAALLLNLQPGVYSFIAKGQGETSGIVLVEVYDAD